LIRFNSRYALKKGKDMSNQRQAKEKGKGKKEELEIEIISTLICYTRLNPWRNGCNMIVDPVQSIVGTG